MQSTPSLWSSLVLAGGLMCASTVVPAAIIGYTDPIAFATAVAGFSLTVEDYDGYGAGTTIASGGTLGAVTYSYDFGGASLQVRDDYETTSMTQFLGTTDSGLLFSGESYFQFSFAPARAFGLYVITADTLINDDLRLEVSGVGIGLNVADLVTTLSGGSRVYFLGLFDTAVPFTQVDLITNGSVLFSYNLDDLQIASAPLPGTLILLLGGWGALVWGRRRGALSDHQSS